jgi:hypothetical protein
MHTYPSDQADTYPASIVLPAATEGRNRLTVAFRFFLALPHWILVGGPVAAFSGFAWSDHDGESWGWGSSGGLIGIVVCFTAVIAWFAILLTGRHPDSLWQLQAYYLRWRLRAIAYMTLLRDEYPPFGDDEYPAGLELPQPPGERDRLSVAFRFFLAIPHLILLGLLSIAWALTTAVAWIAILATGRYPETLYGFAIGVLAWDMRVEAYMLLLRDEYPPFTLRV